MFGICKPEHKRDANTHSSSLNPTISQPVVSKPLSTTQTSETGGSLTQAVHMTSKGVYITTPDTVETGNICVCLGTGVESDGSFIVQMDDPVTLEPINILTAGRSASGIDKQVVIHGDLIVHGKISSVDATTANSGSSGSSSSSSSSIQSVDTPLDTAGVHSGLSSPNKSDTATGKTPECVSENKADIGNLSVIPEPRLRVNIGKNDTAIVIKLPAESRGTVSFQPISDETQSEILVIIEWDSLVDHNPMIFTQFVCQDTAIQFRVLEVTDDGMKWLIYIDKDIENPYITECKVYYLTV